MVFFAVDFFAVLFFAVDFFAVLFFAVDFFAVVFFAVDFFAIDSAALDDVASTLGVTGVVTAEACVTGESIACHCGDAAGSIIRRHNHQPPTTMPPRTARLKNLRMERTLTAARYPRHRIPAPQPALRAERNFSSTAPLLQKACCWPSGKVKAYSQTFAQAIPTARVKDAATVAEIADPAIAPPGMNLSRFVTT